MLTPSPGNGDSCTICTAAPGRAAAGGSCAGDAAVVTAGAGLLVKAVLLPTAAVAAAAAAAEERCRVDRPARRRGRTGWSGSSAGMRSTTAAAVSTPMVCVFWAPLSFQQHPAFRAPVQTCLPARLRPTTSSPVGSAIMGTATWPDSLRPRDRKPLPSR